MYYLVFDTEQVANETIEAMSALINGRTWDTPNYNNWVDKWWTESPQDQPRPRFPQTWALCAPYRLEVDEATWFSNPNPEDPPENP